MIRFATIGLGNMGLAIMDGAVKNGLFKASEVGGYDALSEKNKAIKAKGYTIFADEMQAYAASPILMLAVKPQNFEELLAKLKGAGSPETIIISIAAGISISYIQERLGKDTKVVRVMPNTPAMIGMGASALSPSANVSPEEFFLVQQIFDSIGVTAILAEEKMNDIIPANGSAPALVYYFIDCMAKSMEKAGIPQETALPLICKTFAGSAEMLLRSDKDASQLIKDVCSPGGTTIEAIRVFDQRELCSIIDEACTKCIKRAYELGK